MNEKNPNYLVLVNEENRLPEGFEGTIELISIRNAADEEQQIEKKTYEAFLKLQADLLATDGIRIGLTSIYRTVAQQEEIFARYREKFGEAYACRYVAKPGHSEHHTGLAIDVGIIIGEKLHRTIEELLALDHIFKTVQEKIPQYGFILRYPKGKEAITKIGYEPWHFRYIDSPSLAKEITESSICFEEYRGNAQNL